MISVIIPVYNTQKQLYKSIESILKQKYKNIEILIIDDGSTDKSLHVCKEIAKKDKRIKIIQKENGGVSSARNVGIKNANGEYIYFMDSDDYAHNDLLKNMLTLSRRYNTDLVICGYEINSNRTIIRKTKKDIIRNSRKEIKKFEKLYKNGMINPLWNKLFKKSKIGLFDERITIGEDTKFVLDYISKTESIIITDDILYTYNKRSGSATASFNVDKIDAILQNYKIINEFINNYYDGNVNLLKTAKKRCNAELDRLFESPFYYYNNKETIINIYTQWLTNSNYQKFKSDILNNETNDSKNVINNIYKRYRNKYTLRMARNKIYGITKNARRTK